MCGIAGAFDLTGQRMFDETRLLAMTGAITHRGPDDEGIHLEPGVALGARRLSIVDLAGGHQPIANEKGNIWVAFNGEIFEYPEIRERLLAKGHHLATRCDTEAWVHLYEDFGPAMFDHARGQFGVSLFDRDNRTLILGRDRAGICPLFYTVQDGWLIWGSEIKAILASGIVPIRPNVKALDYFFNFFSATPFQTPFEGIQAIQPGHFLKIKDGRIATHKYWDIDFPDDGDERQAADPSILVDELERHLAHATKIRLRGDVPVASYISGGLDSTVVLGLATRERGGPVDSFTIALQNAGPDERDKAIEAAGMLGSPLTMVTMEKKDVVAAVPELIRAAEMPILDTSAGCLLRLAQAVHDSGNKVVLTGEGADEALAGYAWFKSGTARERFRKRFGSVVPALLRRGILGMIDHDRRARPDRFPIMGKRTAQQDLYDWLGQGRGLVYGEAMWQSLDGYNPYEDMDLPNDRFGKWNWLNQSLYVGYKVMLAGMLLHAKGDRITMNASVEGRYPILDSKVIEFCASIHPKYKLNGSIDKWLLRQVAAKTLPHQIANRKKTMFRANRSDSFLGPDKPVWVDQLLSEESLRKTGYFDPAKISRQKRLQATIPTITPRRFVLDQTLTCVITTQLWHHIYISGDLCDLPTWQQTDRFREIAQKSRPTRTQPGLPVGQKGSSLAHA